MPHEEKTVGWKTSNQYLHLMVWKPCSNLILKEAPETTMRSNLLSENGFSVRQDDDLWGVCKF